MKRILNILTAIAGIYAINVHADAKLTFDLAGPDTESQTKTISLARFFARIDDPAEPNSFLLYQAGKFFPLYRVDQEARTYTLLTPEVKPTLHAGTKSKPVTKNDPAGTDTTQTATEAPTPEASEKPLNTENTAKESAATAVSTQARAEQQTTAIVPTESSEPSSAATQKKPKNTLHLTPKSKEIAGIKCRVVDELSDKQPIIRHCMADKARLRITEREIRTLARTFTMAREREFGWLGTATKDEKFISIASEDLNSHKTLTLQSISTRPLPSDYLRIPRDYSKILKK